MCLPMVAPSHIHGVSSRRTSSTAVLTLAISQASGFLLLSASRALVSFGHGARCPTLWPFRSRWRFRASTRTTSWSFDQHDEFQQGLLKMLTGNLRGTWHR
ncbi:hypothetical protein CCMA1212_006555 [Trichoderma ghanense]|uniref:Uncharacterized protein n=1 Tax=Trichoderma ghanense TaxID=65468 RepID=A0ABY2H097_9HYPO